MAYSRRKYPCALRDASELADELVSFGMFSASSYAPMHSCRWSWLMSLFTRSKDPNPNKELEEERFWREWADTRLVQVYTCNLYSTVSEAYRSMDYIMDVESFSYASRILGYLVGGLVMWAVGQGLPRKYNLSGKDLPQELLDTVNEFIDAGVTFLLGFLRR
jgi:hypothetical protein